MYGDNRPEEVIGLTVAVLAAIVLTETQHMSEHGRQRSITGFPANKQEGKTINVKDLDDFFDEFAKGNLTR